jgi:hypothetical protein
VRAGCSVGDRFYKAGHAATFGIAYSDWVAAPRRQLALDRQALGEGVDVRTAEEALIESLQNGSVHPSLVVEPPAQAAA